MNLLIYWQIIALALPVGFLFGLGYAMAQKITKTPSIALTFTVNMPLPPAPSDDSGPELPSGLRGYHDR